MKIEIEINASYLASLKIDGRELEVHKTGGISTLKGIKAPELDTTLGGMVASKLHDTVNDIMQAAFIPECSESIWDELDDATAEAVYDRLI